MNDADSKKLEETPFPIQDGPTIPWSVIAPHEAQCQKNHGQSLERLAERGGLLCSKRSFDFCCFS